MGGLKISSPDNMLLKEFVKANEELTSFAVDEIEGFV